MIFRTITDEVTGANKSIGLFGLSLQNVKDKLNEIKSRGFKDVFFNTLTIDRDAIALYNSEIKKGTDFQTSLAIAGKNANKETIALMESTNGAEVSIRALTAAQNASTIAAKAQSAALKALSVAGNMIAMWAISKAISFATEKFDEWIHRAEKAKEATDKLFSSFDEAQSKLSSHKELIDKIDESYEKLSNGVDSLGRNVSLSEEEFAEYQSICNQIAEYYPNMVSAWNKEGDAIVDLKDKVNELHEAYEGEKIAALNAFVASSGDIVDSYNLNADHSSQNGYDRTSGYKQQIEALKAYLDVIQNTDITEQASAIQKLLDKGGEGFSGFDLQNTLRDLDISDYSLDILPSYLSGVIKNLQTQLSNEDDSMRQMLLKMFELDSTDYTNISEEAYQMGTAFIYALDSSFFNGKNTGEFRSFTDDLLNELTGENADVVRNAIDSLLNLDEKKSDFTSTEYAAYIQNLINTLQTYLNLNESQIKLMIGMEVDENPEQYADRLINYVKNRFANSRNDGLRGGVSLSVIPNFDTIYFNKAIEQMSQEYLETLNNLEDTEWDKLYQYINQESQKGIEGIDAVTNAVARLIDEYNNLELATTDTPDPSASISQLIDQLSTQLKPVFDSLKSAYQSIFADDGFTPDSVDISMLESIKSDIEELNNLEDVDINIDMDDFDKFAKILTDANTKEWQAQQAFDDLATAIFNATGATEGMTDESVRLVEQLLESLGVINATEVAEQALNEAKVQAVMAAYDLIDTTESEYIAMLNEAEAAGITRQEVYKLMAAEIAFGNNGLSVEQKIAQLKELANAYGDTATSALATAIMNEYASGHTDADTAINNVMEQINAGLQKVDIKFSGAIKSAGSSAKSAAGSAGKEAGEAYTDALEKELNELDTRMEAGYIDFNDYIQARLDLIEDYYRKGKISADEYYSYLEKHYEKQLSGYNKVLNAVTRRYDKEIDSINEIIDGIKKQNDALEKQLDEYDSALLLILKAIID